MLWININFTYSFSAKKTNQTINYLIKYTDSKVADIEKIILKYNLKEDKILNDKIIKLKQIKKILIQTNKTWKYNTYIDKIILELKNNNNSLKLYVKKIISIKKSKIQNNKILFSKKIKPILDKINSITINIASKLIIKDKLNNKDKQIINLLYQIKLKLNKLEFLTHKNFNSKKDIQNYIISNFKQITFHFKQIKDIVKN